MSASKIARMARRAARVLQARTGNQTLDVPRIVAARPTLSQADRARQTAGLKRIAQERPRGAE